MSARDQRIRLDLNDPEFQAQLFTLEKEEQRAVLNTLRKLSRMEWPQLFTDRGLKWETILSRTGPHGERLASLRISQKFRAVAMRDGTWLRLLTLHPDHDSAYKD